MHEKNNNFKYQEGDYLGPNRNILLVKRIKPKHGGKGYLCEFVCPFCGKHFVSDLYNINRGATTSCGCYQKQFAQFQKKDLTGQRFGHLIVIRDSGKRVTTKKGEKLNVIWECTCDCGEKTYTSGTHLVSGHTTSCGKCCISQGEDKIKNILKKLGINFEQQKRFTDCKDQNSLPFDFYLPDYNCCIEYDGEQHFHIPTNRKSTFFTKGKINQIQKHDQIKNEYCLQKNIRLIRISYLDFDNISINFIKEMLL